MIIRDKIIQNEVVQSGAILVNCVLIDCTLEEDVILQSSKVVLDGEVIDPDCECLKESAKKIFEDLEDEIEEGETDADG